MADQVIKKESSYFLYRYQVVSGGAGDGDGILGEFFYAVKDRVKARGS